MGSVLKQEVKEIMKKHLHDLATDIKPDDELYNSLHKWIPDCFLPSQVDRIKKSNQGEYSQATSLVEFMMHRTDDEFINFCKTLISVNKRGVVEEHLSECLVLLGTSYNALLKEVSPSKADTSKSASEARANPSHMDLDVTNDNYIAHIQKSSKRFYEEKREQAYTMDTKRKGFALVINVQRVEGKEERTGTDIDRNKIVSLLRKLDFHTIHVHNDEDELTHEEIFKKVTDFSENVVDKEARRVAVFILSHGDEEDVICGTDGKTVPVKTLVDAINVQRLAGIPKIVVFQACRGGNTETEQKDNSGPPDLITCYSSKKGYVSYRKPTEGSWFIAALVQVFEKHAHEFEILELMNMVQTEVSVKRTTRGECQTTDTVHNLQKEWFFFPGFPKF